MLLLLLLLLLLELLGAKDVPKDTRYVIKKISSCPDIGYYFQRESTPNSLEPWSCHLCFCQDDGTAVCWKRENRRCDVTSFKHHEIGKRNTRVRRSPFGLTDIFFRDAARDIADKKGDMACKPYESTFSDDCPPADWCIGCTVCDCDSHGNWNCHILSFCPDGKNKTKTTKKPLRSSRKSHSKSPPLKPTKTTLKTTLKTTKPPRSTKTTSKPVKRPNRQANNASAKQAYHKTKHMKKNNKYSKKPLIIHKATRKPTTKGNNYNLNASDRDTITREILKGVVTVMQRMLNNSQKINNQLTKVLPSPRSIQKRSMDKRKQRKKYKPPTNKNSYYKKYVQPKKAQSKMSALQSKPIKVYKKSSTKQPSRYKRNIPDTGMHELSKGENTNDTKSESQTLSSNQTFVNTATADNYLKYFIVTEKSHNDTTEQYIYHLIYTGSVNDSHEREVRHSARTGREFDIVAIDDLVYKSNISLSSENKIINDKPSSVETTSNIIEMKNENQSISDIFNTEEVNNNNSSKSIVNTTQLPKLGYDTTRMDHMTTSKKKILTKNLTRVVAPHLKKYTTTKIVNMLKQTKGQQYRTAANHTEKNLKSRLFNKIADIQNVFKRLLNDFRMSNITNNNSTDTLTAKPKRKKFNIMKYLKKFFRKVFRKRISKFINNGTLERIKLKNHVVEAICEIFDNCVISKKNKKPIESKINELYIESNNIFRSIKIIKGLLHLIDLQITNNSAKPYFKDDIHKLNYILKNQYKVSGQGLTQNQVTQVNYIKNNTELFIQSVGRFANILNDIIAMLTSNKDINQLNRRNTKKYYTSANDSRNLADTKGFIKLKNILKKYNLVQNTFMRKMYETLNKFEGIRHNDALRPQVSYISYENINTTVAIEHFSRNIIDNLRKLKNLAEVLSSRTRKKRNAVGDDDTVEYLLTLMEYMLKQTYPLDTAPVSDGIDLLIDAIKNAPDIKPIRKKVLEYSPPIVRVSRTTEAPPKNRFEDDLSDYNKISNEDSKPFNSSETVRNVGQKFEHDKDDYYKNHYSSKNIFDDNTESVYYERDFITETTTNSNDIVEITVPYLMEKNNTDFQTESYNFDKFVNEKSSIKKFEVYSSDLEEDESNADVTNTTEALESEPETTTTDVPVATTERISEVKVKNNSNSESSEDSDGSKHVPLEWLDDGYEQDAKGVRAIEENVTVATTQLIRRFTTSPTILQKHGDVVVSSMTKEYLDEDDKKNQAKWNAEQLMHRKQMDLLNSLDYGTEKSELKDSDSKDDKYDGFSSYYS